ncbi:MAG: hypothetical protein ACTS4W_01640 [Candidatus Hodgkinia cicadicola]
MLPQGLEQMNGRSGSNDIGSAAIVAERCWSLRAFGLKCGRWLTYVQC